jgi:autotransporter-associated beta strand protein
MALGASAAHAETWVGPTPADSSLGGDWNTATNWNPQSVPNAIGATATIPGTPSTGASTRNFPWSAPTTVGTLLLNDNDTDATITTRANNLGTDSASSSLLTFNGGGSGSTLTTTGNVTSNSANIYSILGPVFLADQLTINTNLIKAASATAGVPNYDNSQITVSFRGSAGSSITGPGGITKNGLSTLVFADTFKAFQGPLIINQGRLRFNGPGGVSQTSSVTVNAGGQLNFEQGTAGPVNTNITLGTASTVVTLNGLGTVEPPSVANGGSYQPGAIRAGGGLSSGFTQTLTNNVSLASDAAINVINNYNFTTNTLVQVGTLTLAGHVSGPGKLIAGEMGGSPLSAGILNLANSNSYTGGTKINLGVLALTNANGGIANLGSGDVYVDGASSQANSNTSQFPTLASGRLQIQTGVLNAIADNATLTLTGDTATYQGNGDSVVGGIAILESGIEETVGGLVLGGVGQTALGTYGSTSSSATFQNDAYFSGAGVIRLVLAGDFNGDSRVNAADYVTWRKNDGSAGGYNTFRQHFGTGAPGATPALSGGASAVPEPGTLLLAVAGVLMACVGRRHR